MELEAIVEELELLHILESIFQQMEEVELVEVQAVEAVVEIQMEEEDINLEVEAEEANMDMVALILAVVGANERLSSVLLSRLFFALSEASKACAFL